MARQITIDVVADASKFGAATRDATTKAGGLGKSFSTAAISGFAMGAAFSVVNGALDLVAGFLGDSSAAAKEDTISQDRLALALKNAGLSTERYTAAIEAAVSANQAKGVSDSEQRAGISDFLDLTGSATDALQLNQATVELAAAKEIPYADAEAMIKSAAAGKTAALEKAGVAVKHGASITEIATAVNAKFGGSLDAVALTQSGRARIASEKLAEAQERVGRIINNVATAILPVLVSAFADVVDFLVDNVIPVLSEIAKVVVPILQRAFQTMAPIVLGTFAAIAKVAQVMGPIIGAALAGMGTAIGVLSSAFTAIGTAVSRVFAGVVVTVKGAVNSAVAVANGIIRWINSLRIDLDLPDPLPDFHWAAPHLDQLPYFHTGGIVGAPGSHVAASRTVNIHVAHGVYIDGPSVDRLARTITDQLRLVGVL